MTNRKAPRNHKVVNVDIDVYMYDRMPLDEAIRDIQKRTADLIHPIIEYRWGDPFISGFQAMNELEIMQADARRKASRAANAAKKAKKEAGERRLLEELKAKYE